MRKLRIFSGAMFGVALVFAVLAFATAILGEFGTTDAAASTGVLLLGESAASLARTTLSSTSLHTTLRWTAVTLFGQSAVALLIGGGLAALIRYRRAASRGRRRPFPHARSRATTSPVVLPRRPTKRVLAPSRTERLAAGDLLPPLFLAAGSLLLVAAIDTGATIRQRATLSAQRATQEQAVRDGTEIRWQLLAIAGDTARIADDGEPAARRIVDDLKRALNTR